MERLSREPTSEFKSTFATTNITLPTRPIVPPPTSHPSSLYRWLATPHIPPLPLPPAVPHASQCSGGYTPVHYLMKNEKATIIPDVLKSIVEIDGEALTRTDK